jgi:hypothetical protein
VYEVNIEVDPQHAAAYDGWLPGHIERILKLPGFLGAGLLRREAIAEGERAGWERRTVQYRLASQRDLQNYLDQHAARMRAEAVELFGDRFHADRRVLSRVAMLEPAPPAATCRNCGAPSPGQYCPECGQRSPARVLTLWELIKEATDDLTHSDSRVWRTLIPLMLKPGLLTREYLLGRRARYLPPFRLYLVLSVLCFLTLGLGDNERDFIRAEADLSAELARMDPEERAEAERQLQELQRLRETGLPIPVPGSKAQGAPDATAQPGSRGKIDCEKVQVSPAALRAAVQAACRKLNVEGGWRRFGEELFGNIPKMMFVFLPLIAFVSFLLHIFSGRYYVEHLLLFVHFHCFVFAAFVIQGLLSRGGDFFRPIEFVAGLLALVLFFYFPIYLYKAMRLVFGQRRWLAVPKFFLLSISYVACLAITFIGLVLYTGWML